MAANIGQAFLGGPGIVPTLAQELASGNFPESRESFHDYIYSKLILGEEKGVNSGTNNTSDASQNHPVFPNTNLSSSYPNPNSTSSTPAPYQPNEHLQAIGETAINSRTLLASSPPDESPSPPKGGSSKKKLKQNFPPNSQTHAQESSTVTSQTPIKVKKKTHHKKKEKTNVCDVCGRGFAEKYTLNRHMLTHTHIKPYSCTKCNMAFSRSDGLAKHMAAGHRRIDAHHCDVCGGTFNSEVSFEQHRREYGNTLPFVCNLCMLAFSQCCHLNYHMKSHSLSKINENLSSEGQDDKSNVIDVSELIPEDFSPPKKDSQKESPHVYLYNRNNNLTGSDKPSHENRRNGENLLDPNIVIKPEIEDITVCDATSQLSNNNTDNSPSFDALSNYPPSSSLASQPEKSSVGTSSPSYLPNTSGTPSSSSALGNANPLSDIDMKKYFDIKIPNPKFVGAMETQITPATTDDGLFRCQLCGKGFTRKYHMQRHVKLHTRGPVPKAHLLDWTRRPYACGVCKMGFTRQHHLTRHMLIHTGERPHSCHVCGKAFRRFTNLSLHVRTVHGAERPFKCSICGRGFPRLYSLQRHLKLHAKNSAALGSESVEHLYTGFKAVGTVNIDHSEDGKSPSYNMATNPNSGRQSPQSPESISSEHSDDDSERYEHDEDAKTEFQDRSRAQGLHSSNIQANQVNDPHVSLTGRLGSSPLTQHARHLGQSCSSVVSSQDLDIIKKQAQRLSGHVADGLARMGDETRGHQGSSDTNFSPQTGLQNNGNSDRFNPATTNSNQNNDRFNPATSNSNQNNDRFNPATTNSNQNNDRFNPATSIPRQSNDERFNSITSLPNQTISNIDLSVVSQGNFTEMDLREAGSFAVGLKRAGIGEGFPIHPQRIQSPHLILNNMERPGSRSMMSQSSMSEFHHNQTSYTRQQQPTQQQLVSVDLSSSRNTMSPAMSSHNTTMTPAMSSHNTTMTPATVRDPIAYSNSHRIDMGSSRNRMNDPPAYTHNQTVGGLQFATSSHGHGLYQHRLPDNISQLDMPLSHPDNISQLEIPRPHSDSISQLEMTHPHSSPSPMPVNSHTNTIQY